MNEQRGGLVTETRKGFVDKSRKMGCIFLGTIVLEEERERMGMNMNLEW